MNAVAEHSHEQTTIENIIEVIGGGSGGIYHAIPRKWQFGRQIVYAIRLRLKLVPLRAELLKRKESERSRKRKEAMSRRETVVPTAGRTQPYIEF